MLWNLALPIQRLVDKSSVTTLRAPAAGASETNSFELEVTVEERVAVFASLLKAAAMELGKLVLGQSAASMQAVDVGGDDGVYMAGVDKRIERHVRKVGASERER